MSHELLVTEDMIARQPPEAQAIIRALLARIAQQDRRITALEAEVAALKKTPRNSSLPPSTEHPHAKPAPQKEKTGRKPGGQPGHPKHERALVPTEQCTSVEQLKPQTCRRCGEKLSGSDPDPSRHQVWELPQIKPQITEYRQHRLTCPCCQITTCAPLPVGVPRGQSGPRLTAALAVLMAACRQSKRKVAWLSETLFGIPCSPGLAVKLQQLATAALKPAYDQLCAALPSQRELNIDESPTTEGKLKAWTWAFVARDFTVFAVRPSRGAEVLDELLTDRFTGVIMCDRAKMYFHCDLLQWCWAHLKRDFQAMAERTNAAAKRLGERLLEQTKRLFQEWHRFLAGTISRRVLKRVVSPLRDEVERLLKVGFRCRHSPTAGTCTELLHHREWLWTFLDYDRVVPTNNAAERALRHGVIWRKLSFGTKSASGSRFVETLLSVIETCRQQKRDAFAFVTQAVERLFHHRRPKSLLSTA